MKHVGDITKLHGWELEPVDCITGGSPCQDLSLAGKRAGLAGERSGLFMEQIRLVKEMRDATRTSALHRDRIKPRYMVWENVAGAFSSNGGKDFQAVLTEIARIAEPEAPDVPMPEKTWPHAGCIYSEVGAWSIAWRLHDAQYWGVPQRRKRIALVADFGGLSAPEVLLERKGLSWYSAEGGEQGQGAAGNPADSTGAAISFQERAGKPGGGKGILIQDEHTGALSTQNKQSVCYGICGYNSEGMKSDNPHSGIYEADTSRTLDLNGGNPACNQGGMAVVALEGNGSRPSHQGDGYSKEGDPMFTLNTTEHHGVAVAFTQNQRNEVRDLGEKSGALSAEPGMKQQTYVVFENHSQDTRYKPLGEVCQTVSSTFGMGGNNQPLVVNEPIVYKRGFGGHISNDGISPTVEAAMGEGGNNMPCVMQEPVSIGNGQLNQMGMQPVANTLDTMHDQQAVMTWGIDRVAYNQGQNAQFKPQFDVEKSASLIAKGPNAVATHTVRRLTPLECERLQGFPDGWTDIGEWTDSKGKVHDSSDSARYKALGNSIAVGYANRQSGFWMNLMKRISAQYERSATLGSLFDGIGGFPLAWEFYNGKGSARWASEIEEFPIAVTKKRFGEN